MMFTYYRKFIKYVQGKIPEGSILHRFISGTFWIIFGSGFAQGSTFICTLVAARLLGSEIFGKFGIIQSTIGMFGLVAGLGMGFTNRRFVAEFRHKDPKRCGEIIGFSTTITWLSAGVMAFSLFIFSSPITALLLKAPDLSFDFKIASILLLLNGLNEAQIGALSGLEDFKNVAYIYFLRGLLTVVLLLVGVKLFGLPGLVGGMAITSIIIWIITKTILQKTTQKALINISYGNFFHERKIFLTFTLPSLISGFIPSIVFWGSQAIIIQYPNGYTAIGIYTAVEQWITIMTFIPGMIGNVSLPILTNTLSENKNQFLKALRINIFAPIGTALLFGLAIIILSELIPWLYGKTFITMTPILIMMVIVGLLRTIGSLSGQILAAFNKMWLSFIINSLWGLTLVVICAFLASKGASGLAWAHLISYSVHSILCFIFLTIVLRENLEKKTTPNELLLI